MRTLPMMLIALPLLAGCPDDSAPETPGADTTSALDAIADGGGTPDSSTPLSDEGPQPDTAQADVPAADGSSPDGVSTSDTNTVSDAPSSADMEADSDGAASSDAGDGSAGTDVTADAEEDGSTVEDASGPDGQTDTGSTGDADGSATPDADPVPDAAADGDVGGAEDASVDTSPDAPADGDVVASEDAAVDAGPDVPPTCTTDDCGVCDFDPSNDNTTCTQDCNGVWNGTAYEDSCGVCDSNPDNDGTTCGPQTVVIPVAADTMVASGWQLSFGFADVYAGGSCSDCQEILPNGTCIGPNLQKFIRAMQRFDLSSIPSTATVTDAKLVLDVWDVELLFPPATGGPSMTFGVHFDDPLWPENVVYDDLTFGQYATVGTVSSVNVTDFPGPLEVASSQLTSQVNQRLQSDGYIQIFAIGTYCMFFQSKDFANSDGAYLEVTYTP